MSSNKNKDVETKTDTWGITAVILIVLFSIIMIIILFMIYRKAASIESTVKPVAERANEAITRIENEVMPLVKKVEKDYDQLSSYIKKELPEIVDEAKADLADAKEVIDEIKADINGVNAVINLFCSTTTDPQYKFACAAFQSAAKGNSSPSGSSTTNNNNSNPAQVNNTSASYLQGARQRINTQNRVNIQNNQRTQRTQGTQGNYQGHTQNISDAEINRRLYNESMGYRQPEFPNYPYM